MIFICVSIYLHEFYIQIQHIIQIFYESRSDEGKDVPGGQLFIKYYAQGNKIFSDSHQEEGNVLTIAGRDATIVARPEPTIVLPMGTQIAIDEELLYPDATGTLLTYKDIRRNGIHVETQEENTEEFLLFTKENGLGKGTLDT